MKKSVIFISISLGLIILLGIGVSYSMWNISVSQDTTNLAESKCFDLSISNQENNISLNNAYPISNDKGKSLTPFTFTVTNTCDITAEYSVNLEVLKDSTLSSKFVDVMLENNDIKEINLLSNFDNADKVNTGSIESRKLTTCILKSQESKNYSLRLWIDYNTTLEDLNDEVKSFKSKIIIVGKPINFNYDGDMVFNFDYKGTEQIFTAPVSGTYRLETWGAQGGYPTFITESLNGGLGGYSSGLIELDNNAKIYINVGGKGGTGNKNGSENLYGGSGGYNGGGNGGIGNTGYASANGGGGATHISTISGVLSTLEKSKNSILIVSGGGGGYSSACVALGGSAGGFKSEKGSNNFMNEPNLFANNATQDSGYAFGRGSNGYNGKGGTCGCEGTGGGGGGYYGGYSYETTEQFEENVNVSGAGGSGYIGNSLLTNKVMYCYNCEESNEESTKTISTTCSEETPTSYCAKKGNGYARITLVSIDE